MTASKRRRHKAPLPKVPALMLAPAVITARLPILEAEAVLPELWRTETIRASTEKVAAAAEGLAAAQLSLMRSSWNFWPDLLSGRVPALVSGKALQDAANAAMKPTERRVRANFRRLSRG